MRIAIIGPTHPYKGGIAKHTTELAHRLAAAGHDVTLVSWKHQYPFFYPGQQFVPNNKPEVAPFPNTLRVLSWRNPLGWIKWARKLGACDHVFFVWWVPVIQGPVYWVMLRALSGKAQTTLVVHNIMRHEAQKADALLVRQVLRTIDHVIVHSEPQAMLAKSFGGRDIITAPLPAVLPPRRQTKAPKDRSLRKQLLFFGIVRHYKGLDVLIRALASVPGIRLIVAGEIWGDDSYAKLAADLGLTDRIEFRNVYTPDDQLEELFAAADALVLPYRGGTATFNVAYAHYFHIPVIATRAASIPTVVRDGRDGLLCNPDDAEALSTAIRHFYEPGVAARLQAGVPEVSADSQWASYLENLSFL